VGEDAADEFPFLIGRIRTSDKIAANAITAGFHSS